MIAFLINEIDVRGGTHKQFLELLDYASSQGEDFVVLTRRVDFEKSYPGFAKYADKITVIHEMPAMRWWKRFTYGWLRYVCYFRKLLAGVDVVNIHDCGFERCLWLLFGKKVVWQINDLPFAFREGNAKDCIETDVDKENRRKIRKATRLFVDRITVNVSKNAERVKRHLGMNAKVLYCGITPVNVVHDNMATIERFKQNRIRILSSGVFFPYRNYETLLDAFALIRDEGIDATLNIFGAVHYCPDYHRKIQSIIDKKGLNDYVKILGQIDEARYRELHAESDVFCFVNVDQSWGLAVFEAMSAGIPVVVSKSVGATEILHDGIDATFVDPLNARSVADAILKLMRDPISFARIQDEGRKLVGRYTWEDAYCRPMLDLIRSCRNK